LDKVEMMRKPILTAHLNLMVPPDIRIAVEKLADERDLSIGEAARHLLGAGIQAVMA